MISPETLVFAAVAKALREKYTGIFVSGEYVDVPAKFPAVTIVEAENRVASRMTTRKRIENAVQLMYEVNVFSNEVGFKAIRAKEILADIDAVMADLGFTRITSTPMPNLEDTTIYRHFARYEGYDYPEYDGEDVNHRIYTR